MTCPRTYPLWTAIVLGFSLGTATFTPDGFAQDSAFVQSATMHLRVLTYDRNMASRGGKERVIIGMVYNPDSEASQREARNVGGAIAQAATTTKLNGRQVSVVLIPWSGDEMSEAIYNQGVSVLYVASSTWEQLEDIKSVAAALKTPTMTGSRSLVESGIGVGVLDHGDRISVVINRKAAKAHGMRLDARIFKHAELI